MTAHRRLLLIEPRADDRELLRLVFSVQLPDVALEVVDEPLGFARHLAEGDFDAIIAEQDLGWTGGLDLLSLVGERWPGRPRFLFASRLPDSIASQAAGLGLSGYLAKTPGGFTELPRLVGAGFAQLARQQGSGALAELIAELPVGIVGLDAQGTVLEANPAATRLLGGARGAAIVGRSLAELAPGLGARETWLEPLAGGAASVDRLIAAPGAPADGGRKLRLRIRRSGVSHGGEKRFDAVVEDIRNGASGGEDAGARDELQRATQELEQLAYAVSHDLQEPLQLVARNARLLSSRYGERLDEDAGRFLGHLVESASRMQGMIDGVLAYSRLGGEAAHQGPVDLDEVLGEVLDNLAPNLEEAGAKIHRSSLPTVMGERQKLRQLFQNLVANALKFRGSEPLELTVSARDDGDQWRLMVKDNGIGIEPRFHERIFGMFQRLHTSEEYPGTGIGLAICKRIVQQQGGRLWVKSQPGEGAAFYFTLPK